MTFCSSICPPSTCTWACSRVSDADHPSESLLWIVPGDDFTVTVSIGSVTASRVAYAEAVRSSQACSS